ncbi:TetR-like C-terminal domain-containing protein, partial [Muricomes intestini]|uniref:TetR-like C-terminal domain-containing protein n=1 Tax=Muricomes intestini TaxID=1796634 RepID=UPI002FE2F32C
ISTNTFYYHFRDIYDLLDTWLQEQKERYISSAEENNDWQNMLKEMLQDMKKHQKIVNHICDSLLRDRLERYMFETTDATIYNLVCHEVGDRNIPEDRLRDIADFCRYAFLGFILKYIWSHMSFDIEESVDRLSVLFEGFIHQAIEGCTEMTTETD